MCSNLLFRPPTGPCKWDYFANDNRWQLKFKFLEGVLQAWSTRHAMFADIPILKRAAHIQSKYFGLVQTFKVL